jgi:HEAT repeat protein
MREGVKAQLGIAMNWEFREEERAAAVERLGADGDAAVIVPLGMLLGQTTPGRLRSALLSTLSALSAADAMVNELGSKEPVAREVAAQILANLGDERAIQPLIRALDDANARVREEVAASLLEFRTLDALPALTRTLLEDDDPDVRMAAAQALGELDHHAALEALERATEVEKDEFTMILIEQSIQRFLERTHARRSSSASRVVRYAAP